MTLLINTASTLKGGGVQVAYSFIQECKAHPQHQYHVILSQSLSNLINQQDFPSNFHFYKIPYRPATKVFTLGGPSGFFTDLEKKIKPDAVFTTSGPAYWRPKAPHLMGFNLGYYIYPESPFMQELTPFKQIKMRLRGQFIHHYFRRDADAYVVQTNDVNTRLQKWISKPASAVHTVTNTYGEQYKKYDGTLQNFLPARFEGEQRFLMLSAWYFHKNFGIINKVCDLLEKEGTSQVRFVLTLPQDVFEQNFSATAKKYIHNIGPVKPALAPALYAECDYTFLPTLVECFSATYAESMLLRKPIITSDMGFAHTVCMDAALYFEPKNAASVLATMKKLMGSKQLQQELIDNGIKQLSNFTDSPQRAAAYLKILESMVKEKK
jgi:glycosyltransferase involved in cell wall biosynthesis